MRRGGAQCSILVVLFIIMQHICLYRGILGCIQKNSRACPWKNCNSSEYIWLQPYEIGVIESFSQICSPYILTILFSFSSIPVDCQHLLNSLLLSFLPFLLFIDRPTITVQSHDMLQAYRNWYLFCFRVLTETLVHLLTSNISRFFNKKAVWGTFCSYRHMIRKYFSSPNY